MLLVQVSSILGALGMILVPSKGNLFEITEKSIGALPLTSNGKQCEVKVYTHVLRKIFNCSFKILG